MLRSLQQDSSVLTSMGAHYLLSEMGFSTVAKVIDEHVK